MKCDIRRRGCFSRARDERGGWVGGWLDAAHLQSKLVVKTSVRNSPALMALICRSGSGRPCALGGGLSLRGIWRNDLITTRQMGNTAREHIVHFFYFFYSLFHFSLFIFTL